MVEESLKKRISNEIGFKFWNEKQHSEAWQKRHELSSKNISFSASVIASICGVGYESPWTVFKRFTDQSLTQAEHEACLSTVFVKNRGLEQEKLAIGWFQQEYAGVDVLPNPPTMLDISPPFISATSDMLCKWQKDDFVVEVKYGGTKISQVEDIIKMNHHKHFIQIQLQMLCYNVPFGWLFYYYYCPKKCVDRQIIFRIERNDAVIERIKRSVKNFNLCVAMYNNDGMSFSEDFINDGLDQWRSDLKEIIEINILKDTMLVLRSGSAYTAPNKKVKR